MQVGLLATLIITRHRLWTQQQLSDSPLPLPPEIGGFHAVMMLTCQLVKLGRQGI